MSDSLAFTVALKIFQEAVNCLLRQEKIGTSASLAEDRSSNEEQVNKAIAKGKELLNWSDNAEIQALRVIFDQIELSPQQQQPTHYWQPQAIANEKPSIPYPQLNQPTSKEIADYLDLVAREVQPILKNRENWDNLALLTLIVEKYGSFISLGEEDVAFVDLVRSTAALAAVLVENREATQLSLIVGDLSGVQKFIYTISSAGALKSLRARSFYLELVTEEIVQQLLKELNLPSTNVIFAGASKLYILAAATEQTKQIVGKIGQKFNDWLRKEFQGKVFLALDNWNFKIDKISTREFADEWSKANKNLDEQRSQKFKNQLEKLLNPQTAHEPCKVCHRDDVKPEDLKILNNNEPTSPMACPTCCQMFELGEKLFKSNAIVRSRNQPITSNDVEFKIGNETIYYNLFVDCEQVTKVSKNLGSIKQILLINNWKLEDYSQKNTVPLLLGNYYRNKIKDSEENQEIKDKDVYPFTTAEELAEISQGIKRVGYVRMDVDNLGQIFAKGLYKKKQEEKKEKEKQIFSQIAGLSRQMTYFFKVYLNSLAENRDLNFPEDKSDNKVELSDNKKRDNLLFIYAGGDDLFISGAWNEIVEFSFDIYQCFRAYTGNNPDITISAGISLAVPKFPLYQAAAESGDAEEAAKGNAKDSLTLFGETFKWDEWLGNKDSLQQSIKNKAQQGNLTKKEQEIIDYLKLETYPKLLGVFPFVEELQQQQIGIDYSRNFVRNLLNTAKLQEQKLEEIEQKRRDKLYPLEDKDIKYYLHLPQIAYTLARLEKNVEIKEDFRKSLKNPRNAPYYRAIATWIELLNR